MFDLTNANDEQKTAVTQTEGPVLIIAGPGTGKTFTLVKRIAYLVLEQHVAPGEIMAVTFTEKAARELVTRISDEFLNYDSQININEMYIGTFHAVCLRLLKENFEYIENEKPLRMMDAFEQTYLICRNIETFSYLPDYSKNIPFRSRWKQAQEICRYVNMIMEELTDIDALLSDCDKDMQFLGKIVVRYRELLKRQGVMDFSSIQTGTWQMLMEHPDVLKRIQNSIRYIMVDEYQDTNYIQEQLVFMLAGDSKNICVVGDDDQGMYRFRGATIRNILEFPSKFPTGECTILHLNKNYRSEPDIIRFYNRWMENADGINLFNWDKYRYDKQIVSADPAASSAPAVFACGGTEETEREELLRMIRDLKDHGFISDFNQIACLFRSVKSEEAADLGSFLEANGIPVYSPRSDMFFERQEVRQILGCLMLCFYSYLDDLKKNTFSQSIPDRIRDYYITCVKEATAVYKSNTELNTFIKKQIGEISNVNKDNDTGILDIFYKLMAFEPFKGYLSADLQENVLKTRAARNISEISRLLSRFSRLHGMHSITRANKVAFPEELFNVFFRYLFVDGLGEYEDDSEYAPKGCVSFMTIHQSKGLEFPVVVVGSLGSSPKSNVDDLMRTLENRFFHRPPFEPLRDIKYFDFWRLYYTAFSRAQNLLVLAYRKRQDQAFRPYFELLPHIRQFHGNRSFTETKRINFKRMYSFTSHIAVYDGCPLQYKFYKEYGFVQNRMFHTSVGSLVHATLEDMNKSIISGHMDRVNEELIREWFVMNCQKMQENTGYYLTDKQQDQALQQVIRYYHRRKNELGRVWKAEEEISLVLPEYVLQGVIDLVEGFDNTVEIVDYKTGPKPDVDRFPQRVEHYRKQLEIYAYLIEKRYGKKVSRMHLYYTSTMEGDPLISFDWNRTAVDRTIVDITETVRKIEAKEFRERAQNAYVCKFCDMRYFCGSEKIQEEG